MSGVATPHDQTVALDGLPTAARRAEHRGALCLVTFAVGARRLPSADAADNFEERREPLVILERTWAWVSIACAATIHDLVVATAPKVKADVCQTPGLHAIFI